MIHLEFTRPYEEDVFGNIERPLCGWREEGGQFVRYVDGIRTGETRPIEVDGGEVGE